MQLTVDLIDNDRKVYVNLLSTDLDRWLHTVADEDDSAHIEPWLRQLAKSKLAEAEFAERVRAVGARVRPVSCTLVA